MRSTIRKSIVRSVACIELRRQILELSLLASPRAGIRVISCGDVSNIPNGMCVNHLKVTHN
jgi:hypothetical protein